ncbi:SRPBCC family protein [Thermomonospora umbrina]|uniref:Polyketide cyclase/dehydrase/lipid transport protein n=1 Tax=Thermomonospora umbrina TaxID=111806 RepID=A0A3D9STF6_9ACTN|nr:SRPBCC family protein [Thermomonospora umbrina]REE95854.1 polyketide cyclase/dehydrase/lipid transport protein [Thermomonospora umbrina]
MEYEASRAMPAESRIVFDIAADVAAMHRWLPEEITVRSIADDLAEADSRFYDVREDRDGLMRKAPEQLRLEWGSRGRPDYAGWLQVSDQGAGTSEVVVHLSFLADQPAALGSNRARDVTQRLLQHSLDRLAEEVGRRVTQPGA